MAIGNTGAGGAGNVGKATIASQIVGSGIDQKGGVSKLDALTNKANGVIDGNQELSLEGALTEAIGLKE